MGSLDKRFPVYGRLLRLYPLTYQERYRAEMLQTLADMLDDPERPSALVWARTIIDLPLSLAHQQLSYAGGIMKNETPIYVKRNSAIAASLITPFFVLIVVNSLFHHALDFTNSWKRLFTWLIIGLPAVALILSLVTFIKWSARQKSIWKSLFDFRHNWLLVIPGGLALLIVLFVPFHDSGPCLAHSPVKELRNFSNTVRCIQRS